MNQGTTPNERRQAIIALVLVNAMWGASFPIMKCLNLQVDDHFAVTELTASGWLRTSSASWLIGLRFAIAFGLFAILLRGTLRRVQLPHLLAGAAIGVMFFLGLLLQVIGLATIPASRSGFLTSLVVIITPLINTLLRKQLPRRCVMLGALVALAGVATLTGLIVIQDGQISLASDALSRWTVGDSLTTLATLFFSAQILLVDVFGKRYESVLFTPSMFGTTAILAMIVFAGLSLPVPETATGGWTALALQPRFYLLLGVLCFFPSLVAFVWMNKYQPRLTAGQAAVIYTCEPLFASTWAMFIPAMLSAWCAVHYANEEFSTPLLIGGSLVLVANILALWPEKRPEKRPEKIATAS
ncbi:DMT family transporter [Novipirellula rosea]|uniref:DMT family transporter n=1 Tax=Novipirellula rosea TaxID=1031540 RepID=A0ABP8N5G6_9BACT